MKFTPLIPLATLLPQFFVDTLPAAIRLYFPRILFTELYLLTFSAFISYISLSFFNRFHPAFRDLWSPRDHFFLLSLIGLSFLLYLTADTLSLILYLDRIKSAIRIVSGDVDSPRLRGPERGPSTSSSSRIRPSARLLNPPSRLARY